MLQKQKDRAAMQKVLGKEDAEKPKPRTIRDRINDLQHKQYIKGAQIFATQYTTMHKCAETNNLSGLGHFLRTGDVDARDRFDGASGFSGSSPFFVSLAWRSAMAAVRPRLHVASRYKSMSGTVCGTHSMRPLDRLSGSTA